MGKIRRFLVFFASLFILNFAGNTAAVAGYTCPDDLQYISCRAGYYLTNGNCLACPSGSGWTSTATPTSGSFHTLSSCTCPDGYWQSPGDYNVVQGESCQPQACQPGEFLGSNGCENCPSDFPSSEEGSTSINQCYKTCTIPCTQPECPEHSISCEYGTETSAGIQYYNTQTCSPTESLKTCSIKSIQCQPGYAQEGNSCVQQTYTLTFSCGSGATGTPPSPITNVKYGDEFELPYGDNCIKKGYSIQVWDGGTPQLRLIPGSWINWAHETGASFVGVWETCNNNISGGCGCETGTHPVNGSCVSCTTSCSGISGFTLGTYDICGGSSASNTCYRNCTTSDIPNSKTVSGTVTKGGTNSCTVSACATGYKPSSDKKSCVLDEYTITLNKNGGTGTINGTAGTANATQLCEHGVECTLPSTGLTRNEYAFQGWGDSPSCTSGVTKMTFTAPKTIYACWLQQTTACSPGKYYNGSTHVDCPAGMFCPGTGSASIGIAGCGQECPPGGTSASGATAKTQCYKECAATIAVENGTGVSTGNAYYNESSTSYPACTYNAQCNEGYISNDSPSTNPTCIWADPSACPPGYYCPPDGSGPIKCPDGGTSDAGATIVTQCYVSCAEKNITGGKLTPVNTKENWTGSEYPTCKYNANCNEGYSVSGNGTAAATCNKCQDGQYCPGGTSQPEDCPAGSYCEEGVAKPCPDGGTSKPGSSTITQCYKECKTLEIANGTGIATGDAYYDNSSKAYPACIYNAQCNEGYISNDSPSTNPTCIWADPDACPPGYYCPPDGSGPIECPDGGTSDPGATTVTQCYKIFADYENFQNGVADAKCFYQTSTKLYDACSIIKVHSCIAGYWYAQQNAFLCSGTDSGYYSPAGDITQTNCPVDPSGGKVESLQYADSFTDCYKTCKLEVAHSATIAAKENTVYGITADKYAACSFNVTCQTGYTVVNNNSESPTCNANEYTVTLDKNGGTGSTPSSIKCTFDSGSCALPAVTGLSRPGYTIQAKWCTDKTGSGTCYNAGQTTSANISATGTDITLYAIWTPNVYEVNLDHQSATSVGAPAQVYLKFATGWFLDNNASKPISKLTTVPTKTGYQFSGYYSAPTNGTQIISSDGTFLISDPALTFTTSDPATIYARWAAGTTYCAPGTYYTGVGSQCQTCTENHYCMGGEFATDGGSPEGLSTCPEQGLSESGASSITQCYKTGLSYTATHGSGTQVCNYDNISALYVNNCREKEINLCDAGYYLANPAATDPDCDPVGKGYYSGGDGINRTQCPSNGDTETDVSTSVQQCFKTGVLYEAVYGSGTQRCFYSNGTGADAVYQRDCDTKVINSCRGGYWLEQSTDIDCVQVGLNYYSISGDIERHACPANGKTNGTTSDDILLCYKDGLPYTEALHGIGEYLCYYTSGSGDSAVYASSCNLPTMVSCDGGYYYDHVTLATDCIPVGIGYYSPEPDTARYMCPANGTTDTDTSASSADCYRTGLVCYVDNGTGTQTCNYNETTQDYSLNCQTCVITSCDEGFSQVGNDCILCPAGYVCTGGTQKSCTELTNGMYPYSAIGTTDVSMCYKECQLSANAASMDGLDYYTAEDTCRIKRCLPAYSLAADQCIECPANNYCDGTVDPILPGDDRTPCTSLGDGDWSMGQSGSSKPQQCYQECKVHSVINGTAYPVNDTAFYPAECEFTGISDSGNPCEIIDGVCVETSCNTGFEMIGGKCVECDRDFALSYKDGPGCLVKECVAGYHPAADRCEVNLQECTIPNAIYAEKVWDSESQSFGPCTIKECEYGYHLAANACVSDVQPCNIENGIGFKEWDTRNNKWGECIVTSCNPGYTSDPSETNEHTKKCGECKNKYSVLGKLAVSSYVQGCEIASCLYQGELYNLEYNECVPICPTNEYEDETGTMVWDESSKKCVRTCKDGYTMW